MTTVDLLRHLRLFVTVAEEAHFGRAADRLGMTQPPVSQGVQRLEQRLGVVLLSRGAGGVHLTPAGTDLLPRARALLEDAQRFSDDAERHRENRGALRIGVVPQLCDRQVAAIVSAARGTGSRVVIASTAPTSELVDAVTAGQLDCALVHHPALITALDCGDVLKVPRWFLVPHDHPTATAAAPAVRSLRGLPIATVPRSHGTAAFDLFVDTVHAKGLDPEFLPAATDRETVAAVAAGRAVGLTTDPRLDAPGVAVVTVPGDDFALRLRLVWRAPGPPSDVRDAIESALPS
ncbi:LysR family transcriptional regulator [Amycolatopsis sp. CA-230715]|uniref:LysR family transcriptional regulator n=1 Tax=Amycolatopsis sp. CA-230715 TaxID=2745196 RepID=UPI001C0239BF|nr:LysR family transcriptional regulator [Amycolatopsis sp. CA-230715]QWF84661.1 Hca operon transcriptional activator HcaR [Amycolatopsis sp. CA-230715]